jgi:hypothetical protein
MDTRELRELAKRATPGPWAAFVETGSTFKVATDAGVGQKVYIASIDSTFKKQNAPNANYIAALSPDVLEGLCDKADERDEFKRIRDTVVDLIVVGTGWTRDRVEESPVNAIRELKAERDALRAENERLRDALRPFVNHCEGCLHREYYITARALLAQPVTTEGTK